MPKKHTWGKQNLFAVKAWTIVWVLGVALLLAGGHSVTTLPNYWLAQPSITVGNETVPVVPDEDVRPKDRWLEAWLGIQIAGYVLTAVPACVFSLQICCGAIGSLPRTIYIAFAAWSIVFGSLMISALVDAGDTTEIKQFSAWPAVVWISAVSVVTGMLQGLLVGLSHGSALGWFKLGN